MAASSKPLVGLQTESGPSTKTVTYSTELGRGAFAVVYRAKCGELPCAAKILHSVFTEGPTSNVPTEKFYLECEYLKNIKHPNVVQYLGVCRDPETQQPALLMEMMDQSLTHFLESSEMSLPVHIEVGICHDVALALEYLHAENIVHRDLSSNNILLIGHGSRAKVSDFGMSKVIDATKNKYATPQTMVPGTVAYMPHEALVENPRYTKKLDVFSFGVLAVQIMTREFPNPTNRFKEVEVPLSPIGVAIVPVLETECRKDHIDKIDKKNPLFSIALECLSLKMEDRPTSQKLCCLLESVKKQLPIVKFPALAFPETCRCAELQVANQELKEKVTSLKKKIEATCSPKAASETKLDSDFVELSLGSNSKHLLQASHTTSPTISFSQWRGGSPLPMAVSGSSFAAVEGKVYCWLQHQMYEYSVLNDTWAISVRTMGYTSAFTSYGSTIIAVSGKAIYSLCDGRWHFHQVRTKIFHYALLIHETYLIAIGRGQIAVYRFTGNGLLPHSCFSLPSLCLDYSSVGIHKGFLYFLGGRINKRWIPNLYRIPVNELLSKPSSVQNSWFGQYTVISIFPSEIASLPVTRSTCITIKDHLLSVGGIRNNQACGDIYRYDDASDQWGLVGSIPTPRYNCLVQFASGHLVVAGGWPSHVKRCNLVEMAQVNL